MLTIALVALRYKLYVAVALSAWTTLYQGRLPAEASQAADAIAWAVLEAPRELPLQDVRLAATMAVYARYESDVRTRPCAGHKDPACADGGVAGGYWQLHQPAGFASPREQAAAWVELVRQATRMCGSTNAGLAMTLSGHCHRGLAQTAARLQAVEAVVQAWNASEKAADGSAPTADAPSSSEPAAPSYAATAFPTADESEAAVGRTDREGAPRLRVPGVRAFF